MAAGAKEAAFLTETLIATIIISTTDATQITTRGKTTIQNDQTIEEMSTQLLTIDAMSAAQHLEILTREEIKTPAQILTLLEMIETPEIATTVLVVAINDKF